METLLQNTQLQVFFQLFLAALLGGIVGLEREYQKKEAGLRTYTLVSLGSALFTIVGLQIFQGFTGSEGISFDPGRVVNSVAIGIGFLGAGLIVFKGMHIEGLTTAAGLWVAGAIGVAVGTGFYWTAAFAAFLAVVVLSWLNMVERRAFKKGESSNT